MAQEEGKYQGKQMKASKYGLEQIDRSGQCCLSIQKAWDPHVHALQELVPQKGKIDSTNIDWLASSKYLSLGSQSKMKIGSSGVNNTPLQKSTKPKKSIIDKAPSQFTTSGINHLPHFLVAF